MPTFDQISDYVQGAGSLTDTEATALLKGAAGWINEGYKLAVRETGANVAALTAASLTSGTAVYALATLLSTDTATIQKIRSLYVTSAAGARQPLEPISEQEMDAYRAFGGTETGDPAYYSILGYDTITLYPTPGSGVTIGGTYHKRPTALSADADIPSELPEEFHMPLIGNYALFKLCEYEGRIEEAERAYGRYLAALEDCKKDKRRFGGHRAGPLRPGRGQRFRGLVSWQDRAGLR